MRTISVPSRNADAALRRWASVRAGQSVPITRTGPALVATAASIRVLMSPCGCGLSVIFIRATIFRNVSCVASGSQHNVTGPMPAAGAIATVRSVNLSCSTAAACAPIAGMSRALAKPGMGAFARIEIETGLVFSGGIALRDSPRISAEEIRQTERPHQEGWIYFGVAGLYCGIHRARAVVTGRSMPIPHKTGNFQICSNPSEAWQLYARVTKIKACDQTHEIDLAALDPAEFQPGETMQIDFKTGATVRSPGIKAISEVAADCIRGQCKTELRYGAQDC